jgi:hypothetical protein
MGTLYLVADKAEVDRRRKLLDPSVVVEAWQDLYAPDLIWMGDDVVRRIAYARKAESTSGGPLWMGERSKRALDRVGDDLGFLLSVDERAVLVYYGRHLTDSESLPDEESLKARVLSAHGIAVACVTYDRFGRRTSYEPALPTDATFLLRRPRGRAAHVWRLFRTKSEATAYMGEHYGEDPEALEWAAQVAVEDFDELLERFGRQGRDHG